MNDGVFEGVTLTDDNGKDPVAENMAGRALSISCESGSGGKGSKS